MFLCMSFKFFYGLPTGGKALSFARGKKILKKSKVYRWESGKTKYDVYLPLSSSYKSVIP